MKTKSGVLYLGSLLFSVCVADTPLNTNTASEAIIASNFNGPLSQLAVNEPIIVPDNFALSFDIKPLGVSPHWTNIIHYSKDKTNAGPEGRVPAVWFTPGTTNLHVKVSTKANTQWGEGIDASIGSLPLNATTNVRVEAFGRDIFLYLNNSLDTMATVSADRISGEATLYVSDPWYTPASASIGSIQMKSLSLLTKTFIAASDFNDRLSTVAVYEKTVVPDNFALSFDTTTTIRASATKPAAPPRPTDGRCTWQPFYYLEANPDLQNAFGWDYDEAKTHWASNGYREGRSPCGTIQPDCKWNAERYFRLNPDVRGKMDPYEHVRSFGLNEGRAICIIKPEKPAAPPRPTDGRCTWQPFYYLEANPDLQNAFGWDYDEAKTHWASNGYREGRSPCGTIQPDCKWNAERYFRLNPDVRGKMDPYEHVRSFGLNEGRAICIIKPEKPAAPPRPTDGRCTWQPFYYLEANPDLQNAFGWDYDEAKTHWASNGYREGRSPCGTIQPDCKWNAERYFRLNPDVRGKMDPYEHVRSFGLNEGRAICITKTANNFNGPLSKSAVYEKTTVPVNFSLSFDIKPFGISPEWTNVIHYTKDGTDGGAAGRIPAIWFFPGTTRLHVRVSTKADGNDGIWASIASLPINVTTNVRVEAFGRDVFLYFNNSLDTMTTVSADRISGEATLYVSDPWWPSAPARTGSIQMNPLLTKTFSAASDFNDRLSKVAVYEKTTVPANFSLSFDIKPFGISPEWTNVIHYTKDGTDGGAAGRIPAIWFFPGTTRLHVRVSTKADGNDGIWASIASLPINVTTNVRVEAFGRDVFLYFNNSLDTMTTVSADRISGEATLYVSDPWWPSAPARTGSIQMNPLLTKTFSAASDFNDRLSKVAVYEKTTVPANFSLSFDIKPFGISPEWTNVIHYTKDGTDGGAAGRIPAIWFFPGTTRLHVRVSTKADGNDGIWASIASLPINVTTNVRVEAFGRVLLLFLNNTFDSMVTVSADRISGEATLYVSDPWYTPASASIGSYQMKSITALTTTASIFNGPLSQLAVNEQSIVPDNFALSFDIKPLGVSPNWTNIIHYSKDKTNAGPEGRVPAVWFTPGTTNLHVKVSTKANTQWGEGIDASIGSLPLNATTNVRVEAFGRDIFLYLNNSLDTMATVSADRISGEATLYVSDPWYTPASASIGSIQMKSLSLLTKTFIAASDFNDRLSTVAVYEKTVVPDNFALSFDIKPLGVSPHWTNIIHYSKDKTNAGPEGRVPAVWFTPGTTNLHVKVSTKANTQWGEGIDASIGSLPLNATTNVRVEAFGRDIFLYLNNSLDTMATVSADRISGEATLYVSDPWYTPASASIGSIQMKSLVYFDEDNNRIVTEASEIRAAVGIVFATIFDQRTVVVAATTTVNTTTVTPTPVIRTVFAVSSVTLNPVVVTQTV